LIERDCIVRIWGQWCGPDWTGGKRVSAQDYTGSWNARCQDDLDCACRSHDRNCSHPDGCSKNADERLIRKALRVAANPVNRIFRKEKVKAAEKIAATLTVAKRFRKR